MKAQKTKSLNYILLTKKAGLQRESEYKTFVEKEHSEETRLQQKNKKRVRYIQSGKIPVLQPYYSGYMPLDAFEIIKVLKEAIEEIKH